MQVVPWLFLAVDLLGSTLATGSQANEEGHRPMLGWRRQSRAESTSPVLTAQPGQVKHPYVSHSTGTVGGTNPHATLGVDSVHT